MQNSCLRDAWPEGVVRSRTKASRYLPTPRVSRLPPCKGALQGGDIYFGPSRGVNMEDLNSKPNKENELDGQNGDDACKENRTSDTEVETDNGNSENSQNRESADAAEKEFLQLHNAAKVPMKRSPQPLQIGSRNKPEQAPREDGRGCMYQGGVGEYRSISDEDLLMHQEEMIVGEMIVETEGSGNEEQKKYDQIEGLVDLTSDDEGEYSTPRGPRTTLPFYFPKEIRENVGREKQEAGNKVEKDVQETSTTTAKRERGTPETTPEKEGKKRPKTGGGKSLFDCIQDKFEAMIKVTEEVPSTSREIKDLLQDTRLMLQSLEREWKKENEDMLEDFMLNKGEEQEKRIADLEKAVEGQKKALEERDKELQECKKEVHRLKEVMEKSGTAAATGAPAEKKKGRGGKKKKEKTRDCQLDQQKSRGEKF